MFLWCGRVRVVEKNLIGESKLFPKGAFAYVTGAGTKRQTDEWGVRGIFSGGSFTYGLTDRLNLGGTLAFQNAYFDPVTIVDQDEDDRQFPEQSSHIAFHVAWQPFGEAYLTGDVAWSDGKERYTRKDINDFALQFDFRFKPLDKLLTHLYYFRYGPDFFNGSNRKLRDREGQIVRVEWDLARQWAVRAAGGQVYNNLRGTVDETLITDFQTFSVSTKAIPRTWLEFNYDRLSADWEEKDHEIYTIHLSGRPTSTLLIDGYYAWGDEQLTPSQNSDFFQGLRLPGFSIRGSRITQISVSESLPWGDRFALLYSQSSQTEEASVIYNALFPAWANMRMRNELGYDFEDESYFYVNQTEIPLGRSLSRLGFKARFEEREWQVAVTLTLQELFGFHKARPHHITQKRIVPEQGYIHGRVFLDRNANALPDAGEPGLAGIIVQTDRHGRYTTDRWGYFVFPVHLDNRKVQLSVEAESIPAIFVCTHCRQQAYFKRGESTEVNFGLTPAHVVIGRVLVRNQKGETEPLTGVRVSVVNPDQDETLAESVTGSTGGYYLQNIKPGEFLVKVDVATIPKRYEVQQTTSYIRILPSDQPQEIKIQDFVFVEK